MNDDKTPLRTLKDFEEQDIMQGESTHTTSFHRTILRGKKLAYSHLRAEAILWTKESMKMFETFAKKKNSRQAFYWCGRVSAFKDIFNLTEEDLK